jgi:hypothetical protein
MMVQDATVPFPLTGCQAYLGSVLPHSGQAWPGGIVSDPHREHRATTSWWRAAAAQYGADCSSGTGTGRALTPAPRREPCSPQKLTTGLWHG